MRAGAEVKEIPLLIGADLSILGKIVDKLYLIFFAFGFKIFQSFFSGYHFLFKGAAFGGKAHHFLFDGFELFFAEGVFGIKVIVKTVFDGGADPKFRTGEKVLHRFSQKMGAAVTENVFAFVIVPGEDLQRHIVIEDGIEVHDLAIHFAGKGIFG